MKILVVLGYKLCSNGNMSKILIDRLDKTIEVQKDFDKILLSGGVANKKANASEANLMKKYLLDKGCPIEKIMIENMSMTTKQNAQFCAPIIEKLNVEEFTILSSQFHIKRKILNPIKLFKFYTKCKVNYIEA